MAGLVERQAHERRARRLAQDDPSRDAPRHRQRLRSLYPSEHGAVVAQEAGRAVPRRGERDDRALSPVRPPAGAAPRRAPLRASSVATADVRPSAPSSPAPRGRSRKDAGRGEPGSVEISIAVIAGLRATAGRMPRPTRSRSVTASAGAAKLTPAVKKQSSMTHSWSAPPSSSCRAKSVTSAAGMCGRSTCRSQPELETHGDRSPRLPG